MSEENNTEEKMNEEFNPLKLFASSALAIKDLDCVLLAAAGDGGVIKLMATGSNLNLLGIARYVESSLLKELLGEKTTKEVR